MGGGRVPRWAFAALVTLIAAGLASAAVLPPAAEPLLLDRHRHLDGGGFEAFSLYVPRGWAFEGGVGGPAAVAFTVSSPDGRSVLRSYPDERFVDLSLAPAGQQGQSPPGSRYQGAVVSPALSPEQFIANQVIPRWRGLSSDVWRVVEQKALPEVARRFQHEAEAFDRAAQAAGLTVAPRFTSAGGLTIEYPLGGVPTREAFVAVLDYVPGQGATVFWPRRCFSIRAPSAELAGVARRLLAAAYSFAPDPRWTVEQLRSEHAAWRAVADVDACVARLRAELPACRVQAMVGLHRELFASLGAFAVVTGPGGPSALLPTGGAWYRERTTGDLVEGTPGRRPTAPGAWEALQVEAK